MHKIQREKNSPPVDFLKNWPPLLETRDRLFLLALSLIPGMGDLSFWRTIDEVSSFSGLKAFISRKRGSLDLAKDTEEKLLNFGGGCIFFSDPDYPVALKSLVSPPPVLYFFGRQELLKASCVGIVGGRNASLTGQVFAGDMARSLSKAGVCVISGLARGIDQAAHRGALKERGGTIGVLAGGIDVLYPKENRELYEGMKRGGLILSQMPPGTPPTAQLFPKRNRIIAGMSVGVVLIEAALKSGSLITARHALEENREVMAVPGFPSDPRHHGCNELLRQGAVLVESADDVLSHLSSLGDGLFKKEEAYVISPVDSSSSLLSALSAQQENLLSLLGTLPLSIEDLLKSGSFSSSDFSILLSELEILGKIKRLPGGYILRTSSTFPHNPT